jgi:hypothetical protein
MKCNAECNSVMEGVLAKSLNTMTFCITAATDIVAVTQEPASWIVTTGQT